MIERGLGQLRDRRQVEVIAVIVGDDHDVGRRQLAERDARRDEPLDHARERGRPHRIDHEQLAAEPERPRRVADPDRARIAGGERFGTALARGGPDLVELAVGLAARVALAQDLPLEDVAGAAPRLGRAIVELRHYDSASHDGLVRDPAEVDELARGGELRERVVVVVGHEQAIPAEQQRACGLIGDPTGARRGDDRNLATGAAHRDAELHLRRLLAPPLAEPIRVLAIELEPQALAVHRREIDALGEAGRRRVMREHFVARLLLGLGRARRESGLQLLDHERDVGGDLAIRRGEELVTVDEDHLHGRDPTT